LAEINKSNNYSSKLITKNECLNKYSGLREDYVQAGLFFPEEVIVEPLVMINKLHAFLIEDGMDLFFNAKVVHCDETVNGVIMTLATGSVFIASKVIICNGSDFKTLYPSIFEESDLVVSKLQMMATKPQQNYSLKGSILTGLSIRRYEAFEECASYSVIKANENKETLEKKWGVHVLFKQAHDGSIILGDSHEYANASEMDNLGFGLNMDIDNFIIHEAKKIIDLPNYEIQRRWFGMYSQCKNSDMYQNTIGTNIHIITGIGGKGMTGSAGFSKQNINTIFNL
jgi:FAD dependent oxidoreductase TIGR03364